MIEEKTIYKTVAIALLLAIIFGVPSSVWERISPKQQKMSLEQILQSSSVDLPIIWGNLGQKLVAEGVIDQQKWQRLMGNKADRDFVSTNGKIHLTRDNAGTLLNYLWALGLANKNKVLDEGEMRTKGYDPSNFASTGGWQIAVGGAMDHYSKHEMIKLTPRQEAMLDDISKNIYRPCCNNSTHFPDCNHGMAMLGLLQLMISQNLSEDEIYQTALIVNAYWFPSNYDTVSRARAQWLSSNNISAKELLGPAYSSAKAMANMYKIVPPSKLESSCGLK